MLGLAFLVLLLVAAGLGYASWKKPAQREVTAEKIEGTAERLARGKYLVETVTNCFDCHSEKSGNLFGMPPVPGKIGAGANYCYDERWGFPGRICFPNITPDPKTGIGTWRDDELLRAIREGVDRHGDALFSLMPYHTFRNLSDEDARSIVAYLRTIPPVEIAREKTSLRFPVSYFIKSEPQPLTKAVSAVDRRDPVAYGKYLAELAGCRSCHTPVDAEYKPLPGKEYAGGQDFVIDVGVSRRSTNITSHPKFGVARLDKLEFIALFKKYEDREKAAVEVPPDRNTLMPWLNYGGMKPEDLAAIYDYLLTVPPSENYVRR